MLTLLASFFGLAGSWIPQLFKIWTDKSDKQHEITLLQMQIDAAKEQGAERLAEIGAQSDAAQTATIYQTYKTGINWVDGYNGTVRPTIAYAFFFTYALSKYLGLEWTGEDQAIFAAVISFYFGDRTFNRGLKK
jgi:hypothetical protein